MRAALVAEQVPEMEGEHGWLAHVRVAERRFVPVIALAILLQGIWQGRVVGNPPFEHLPGRYPKLLSLKVPVQCGS